MKACQPWYEPWQELLLRAISLYASLSRRQNIYLFSQDQAGKGREPLVQCPGQTVIGQVGLLGVVGVQALLAHCHLISTDDQIHNQSKEQVFRRSITVIERILETCLCGVGTSQCRSLGCNSGLVTQTQSRYAEKRSRGHKERKAQDRTGGVTNTNF